MWGSPMGLEFRPLGKHDYGYFDDKTVITTTIQVLLQSTANFQLLGPKAIIFILSAMLMNDYMISDAYGTGASFVWNVQCGLNSLHAFVDKKQTPLVYAASGIGLASDTWSFVKEKVNDTQKVAHDLHALGFGIGLLSGIFL